MVRVTDDLALSPEALTLYHAADPLLGHLPVLAFHGASTTANFTHNSSRIQVHVYSPAGFHSFPRLTISPQSDFYGVVTHLPREFQGDDVCRGLAFALYKYFCELPDALKSHLKREYPTTRGRRPGSAPTLFGEQHAADLAQAMVGVGPGVTEHVIKTLQAGALQTQHVSNIDLDFVLPPGAVSFPQDPQDMDLDDLDDDDDAILDPTLKQYTAAYTPLVKLFGEPVFLPTAKLRRAPSRPSSLNHHRSKTFSRDSKVELRMQLGELVDTEERYVLKLNELVKHVADEFRSDAFSGENKHLQANIDKLFPRSVDRILQVNAAFMQDLRRVMDESEEDAVRDLDVTYIGSASSRNMLASNSNPNNASNANASAKKDPSGALAMAKTFLEWFPKFTDCYQEYIRASQNFPQLLNTLLDSSSPTPNNFRDRVVQTTGEQVLRSILIEPVQRLPRYSLFIDQIVGCLPITHPALQVMLKARDIITNICSMDDPLDDDEEGDGTGKKSKTINRLRNLVESWPYDLEPRGRLILAADFHELSAPYLYDADALAVGAQDGAGLFLLFNDCLVLVNKKTSKDRETPPNGRDLLREIDKPSPAGLLASMTNAAGGPGSYDFSFGGWHSLADVRFTESADGRCIWMTSINDIKGLRAKKGSRCFAMQESYEAKAGRWSEDVTKARIEGRFSESERETPTWTLRSVRLPETSSDGSLNRTLGLHAAVFQEAAEELIEGRREPAPVRIVFDNHLGTKGAPVGHYGVEVVVEVRTVAAGSSSNPKGDKGDARLVMNTAGLNGKKYSDDIAVEDFLPTLTRRITQLTCTQHSPSNPRLIPALVSYHTKTLRSLDFSVPEVPTPANDITTVNSSSSRAEKTRSFLASSPVKLFSSFLGGTPGGAANATPSTNSNSSSTNLTESIYASMRLQRSQSTSSRPALLQQPLLQAPSLQHTQSEVSSLSGSIRDRSGAMFSESINGASGEDAAPANPLVRLEQAFTGYVAALQSRKGQFVARTLLNRNAPSSSDELSVNVLYNRMNESPFDWEEASVDLPADVIFAAFEKFTRIAWRDHMGTIMTIQALDALQERAIYLQKKVPGDFADFVHYLFGDMAPQNRRAFTALIKLLADLLQGCSDDGDRGALTLAFAEVLVAGSPEPAHNYINLLDRLVDDCDRIFDGIGSGYAQQQQQAHQIQRLAPGSSSGTASYEPSFSSSLRTHKSATPSLTSNTSSLRRKFGLEGLLRQNSTAGDPAQIESEREFREREKEKTSMWRSLSKHRHPATGESASLSKATAAQYINRSRSIDMGSSSIGGGGALHGGFAAYAGGSGAFAVTGRRPGSRDRPPIAGAFSINDDAASSLSFSSSISSQRPGSSHRPASSHKQLETIGEPADDRHEGNHSQGDSQGQGKSEKAAKKKRRSSLSDLKSLMAAATLEDPLSPGRSNRADDPVSPLTTRTHTNRVDAPLPPTPLRTTKNTSEKVNSSTPRGPSPSKIPISPPSLTHAHSESHARTQAFPPPSLVRHQSLQVASRQKENTGSSGDSPATSHIPTLKPGRPVLSPPSGASGAGTGLASTSPTRLLPPSPTKLTAGASSTSGTGGSGRLRLQSPQKLRERLLSEKRAVEEVDASLRSELSRISRDMARVSSSHPTSDSLAAALRSLEKLVPQRIQEVADRQASLEHAMEASVRASEAKVRGIDQLYKEATAENELLYEKFNVELAKIVRALKGKGREDKEDLVSRLKEQTEETARLKRDNARLQRETVSLRAMLKEQ
ncbi:rho guanyl nucleotide exchange factor [Ophiostoma piceae UAMH 11346]|uniref:Rho guanyl nucleotide exchange factor n=1 Tax=Ophiostoma piceae (strain UAMH 11346) TaxID=1262450 RepID=S3CBH4_OPHP1|nr:rho guanyl nucleotide exchange factor [Ophiostoma piceae UAMH 11346]